MVSEDSSPWLLEPLPDLFAICDCPDWPLLEDDPWLWLPLFGLLDEDWLPWFDCPDWLLELGWTPLPELELWPLALALLGVLVEPDWLPGAVLFGSPDEVVPLLEEELGWLP
jgi:hypothetical protein